MSTLSQGMVCRTWNSAPSMSKLRCIFTIFTRLVFVFEMRLFDNVSAEIPEIIDGAISSGKNEAVEREALHVIGLGGSFK